MTLSTQSRFISTVLCIATASELWVYSLSGINSEFPSLVADHRSYAVVKFSCKLMGLMDYVVVKDLLLING